MHTQIHTSTDTQVYTQETNCFELNLDSQGSSELRGLRAEISLLTVVLIHKKA